MANRAVAAAANVTQQSLDDYQLQQLRHSLPLFHHQIPSSMGLNSNGLIPSAVLNLLPNLNGSGGVANGIGHRKREHDEELKPEVYNKVQRGKQIFLFRDFLFNFGGTFCGKFWGGGGIFIFFIKTL